MPSRDGEVGSETLDDLRVRVSVYRFVSIPPIHQSGLRRRQMLAHRIPPEAKLQADLDVGTALSVELLGTLEIIAGEVSLAAGWSLGLAARGADGGLSDTDLGSDLAR